MFVQPNSTNAFGPVENPTNTAGIARPNPVGRGTFQDAQIHRTPRPNEFHYSPRGYGIDLNGDGRFDQKQDGILSFDFNRDGNMDDREIETSNRMLKAFGGNFDANGDGRVGWGEFFEGVRNYQYMSQMDRDRDGVLSQWELKQGGAKVWIDKNGDGRVNRKTVFFGLPETNDGELHQLFDLPGGPSGRLSLNFLDPYRGISWFRPDPQIRPFPLPLPSQTP